MTPLTNAEENSEDRGAAANARRDALRLLAYRARSQAEVRGRLEQRYPREVVDQVIAQLLERRYLDDAAFARDWRQRREQSRPRSEMVLKQELRQHGVDPEVIEEALEGFDADANAYDAARTLARRLSGGDYSVYRRRVQSHLQRRGFSPEVIQDVARRLWRELADPLDCGVDPEQQED